MPLAREMVKIDMKKEMKELYGAKAKPQLVDVPRINFLMVDGTGDPNDSKSFEDALKLLYGLSYTIKFDLKKAKVGPEYSVMPLEGLWWAEKGPKFEIGVRGDWIWTLLIAQPEHVNQEHVDAAKEKLHKKDPSAMVGMCKFESFCEGRCVQMLHVGPYATEPETVMAMKVFMEEKGLRQIGKHHEIYLGDPRRTDPSKLKTILRHPVE